MMEYDVVIIGAGIAGLSAACAVTGCRNLSVAIIESKGIGSNNPTPLTFRDVIESYGLTDCTRDTYSMFSFHNHSGSTITCSFKKNELFALDYKKACLKLMDTARHNTSKLEYISDMVNKIDFKGSGVYMTLDGGLRVSARIVIDASGKAQVTARQFNLNSNPYYSHVFGALFRSVKIPEAKPCCFLLPNRRFGSGGGWFYSIAEDMASFGYATISEKPDMNLDEMRYKFDAALHQFKPYSHYLKDAHVERFEHGVIPVAYLDRFVIGNILIAGDAAGMATNWNCMGVEPALKYGRLAGELAAESICRNDLRNLESFQGQWERDNKARFDSMRRQGINFWNADHYFWEWIIRNDLAYLSSSEVIERMRWNLKLIKPHKLAYRALKYKAQSLLTSKAEIPISVVVQ